jgi:hypothetical protein
MLYEHERHEPLTANAWNEHTARACIDEIFGDAVDRFSARDLWPSHPHDTFSPNAQWNLYNGAAGTIWALRRLSRNPDTLPDFSGVVSRLLEPNRNWILNVKGAGLDLRTVGLLTGDTGILLVQAMVNGVETVAVELGALSTRTETIQSANSCGAPRAQCWHRCGSTNGRAMTFGPNVFVATQICCGTSLSSSRRPAVISGFSISTAITLRILARCMDLAAMPSP